MGGDVLKLTKEGIFWSGNISEIFISDEEWRHISNPSLTQQRKNPIRIMKTLWEK